LDNARLVKQFTDNSSGWCCLMKQTKAILSEAARLGGALSRELTGPTRYHAWASFRSDWALSL
jgi:hypothetical protein